MLFKDHRDPDFRSAANLSAYMALFDITFVADVHGYVDPFLLENSEKGRSYLISSVVFEEEIQEFGMGERKRGKTAEVDIISRLGHIPSRNILQKLRCRKSQRTSAHVYVGIETVMSAHTRLNSSFSLRRNRRVSTS